MRASQHELFSLRTYDTFRTIPGPVLKEPVPGDNYSEPLQTTFVLVAYYKNREHLEWILKNKLYNVRTDFRRGALKLSHETVSARYLLLHGEGSLHTDLIFELAPDGPRVLSKEYLQKKKYPSGNIRPYYIGYTLQSSVSVCDKFDNIKWNITQLPGYHSGRNSALPFSVTLEQLMHARIR